MSLADQASLLLIPSGYKSQKVYSVFPTDGDGNFDFSRSGSATRIAKNGLITTVDSNIPRLEYPMIDGAQKGCPSLILEPQRTNLITYSESFPNIYWTKSGVSIQGNPSTQGSELVTNGNFATDSDWIKDSGWTISGGLLNCNNSTTNNTRQLISDYSTSKLYLVTYTISNYSSGGVRFDLGYNNGVTRNANGTYTEQLSFLDGGAFNGYLRIFSDGASQLSIDNLSVKEVQGFTSPDGSLNSDLLQETSANSIHYCREVLTVTSGVEFTVSFFAKKKDYDYIQYSRTADGSSYANFNIANGTIGNNSGADILNHQIEDYGNGWYRCIASITTSSTSSGFGITLIQSDVTSRYESYLGDDSRGTYIYGAQAEEGSYPTSYIPNYGTALGVTRQAETCNGAGDAATFNDSEGVLMAEISQDNNSFNTISISDGGTSDRITIAYQNNTIKSILVYDNNVVQLEKSTYLQNSFHKVAIKYTQSDFSLIINGFELLTASKGSFGDLLNTLQFAQGNGGNNFYGKTKQIQYHNSALTESELSQLTSWTSFTDMANGQQYSIK